MYVCICNALREKDVRRAAEEGGATRPAEVFRFHGCAPQCGKCACHMRAELLQSKTCGNCGCEDAAAVTANVAPIAAE